MARRKEWGTYTMQMGLLFLLILAPFLFWIFQEDKASFAISAPKPWMIEQIRSDLQSVKGEYDFSAMKSAIDAGVLKRISIVHILKDGIETYPKDQSKRVKMIVARLKGLQDAGVELPQTTFLLGDHDHWSDFDQLPQELLEKMPPVFAFAADKADQYRNLIVLMPDDHTLGNHKIGYRRGWHSIAAEIDADSAIYSWHRKKNVAFWRGLHTDALHYGRGLISPRARSVQISESNPELVDSKFTHIKWGNEFVIKNLRPIMQVLSIPPYISQGRQLEYKMLINMDGYTATYPGLLWRLYSGCVTLRQESGNEQWFYNILKPWEHYVPLQNDVSDLLERASWVRAHDAEAQKIASAAKKLVEENLMSKHINAYLVTLLWEYSAKSAGNLTVY